MAGEGVFNNPYCCNNNCECPVCLTPQPLKKFNCNHYVCELDIINIINSSNPRCPICRAAITEYGCDGNIINVEYDQTNQHHIIPNEDDTMHNPQVQPQIHQNMNGYNIISDDEEDGYNGGSKRKKTKSRKKSKTRKKLKTRMHLKRKTYKKKKKTKASK